MRVHAHVMAGTRFHELEGLSKHRLACLLRVVVFLLILILILLFRGYERASEWPSLFEWKKIEKLAERLQFFAPLTYCNAVTLTDGCICTVRM